MYMFRSIYDVHTHVFTHTHIYLSIYTHTHTRVNPLCKHAVSRALRKLKSAPIYNAYPYVYTVPSHAIILASGMRCRWRCSANTLFRGQAEVRPYSERVLFAYTVLSHVIILAPSTRCHWRRSSSTPSRVHCASSSAYIFSFVYIYTYVYTRMDGGPARAAAGDTA